MVYENVGNLQCYKHVPREVRFLGLVSDPSLVLKLYHMYIQGSVIQSDLARQSQEFLEQEIRKEKIAPHSGMGFAIVSEDMLNVARWDEVYPTVLKNQVYSYTQEDLETAQLRDLQDVGSFCIWELGIVEHERRAWTQYLQSERMEREKKFYLESILTEPL